MHEVEPERAHRVATRQVMKAEGIEAPAAPRLTQHLLNLQERFEHE